MLKKDTPLELVNAMAKNTMVEHLGIEIIEISDDYLVGTMPVDRRTLQPAGLLHGGASCALIETIGSIGSTLIVDHKTHHIVGVEINANHIRGVKEGTVKAVCKLVHGGRKTHVWQCDLTDENDKLVCTGRLTVMVYEINA